LAYANNLRRPEPASEPLWETKVATYADMQWLAPRLTFGSLDEIEALSKFQPVSVLLKDIERKRVMINPNNPTQPVAVFEVSPIPGQDGAAFWAALTDSVTASSWFWSFTHHAGSILNLLNRSHPSLSTYVDARNVQHIHWLERIGFNHVEDIPQYGRKELPFKLFSRTASAYV